MPPPQAADMFALLVASILAFIESGKAANSCTIVDLFAHLAEKRLPGLAKHLANDPRSLSKDFHVGHSTMPLPDVPYASVMALETQHVLTPKALNRLCFSTGFCNMALTGKFVCFKAKYLVRAAGTDAPTFLCMIVHGPLMFGAKSCNPLVHPALSLPYSL